MRRIDLVMEGGGARGIAHVGALEALAERDIWPARVMGTSVGAIVAALVAAGYTAREIRDIVLETDFRSFLDRGRNLFGWPIFGGGGMYRGNVFLKWMFTHILAKRNHNGTLNDLQIPLTVIAADITHRSILVLNSYTVGHLLSAALAVRMSMSVPIVYDPVVWRGAGHYGNRGRVRVVDGGIVSNYPIHLYLQQNPYFAHTPEDIGRPTLGFLLDEGSWSDSGWNRFASRVQLLSDAVASVLTAVSNRDSENVRRYADQTIKIDVQDTGIFDFGLSRAEKEDLFVKGHKAVASYLDSSQWAAVNS